MNRHKVQDTRYKGGRAQIPGTPCSLNPEPRTSFRRVGTAHHGGHKAQGTSNKDTNCQPSGTRSTPCTLHPEPCTCNWYLIQCRPKQEQRAQEHLQNQGFESFLPRLQAERIKKGKRQHCDEPLFPGYLFIRLDPQTQNWSTIRSTRGVRQLVQFGGHPAEVPQDIITELQQQQQKQTEPAPALQAGQKLRITQGPFAQLQAIFENYDGEERVIVLLELLHKQHRLKLNLSDISSE